MDQAKKLKKKNYKKKTREKKLFQSQTLCIL